MNFEKYIDCGDFVLEKITPDMENARELLSVINDNRDYLSTYLEWVDDYTTLEKTLANIKKSYSNDVCSYFITIGGKIVGKIGFVDIDENMGEISYWLTKKYTGRGIMTRALNLISGIGFNKIGLNRIQLTLDADNIRSEAVAQRCGFQLEGILRKYFLLRGVPRDMKMFSKVKTDN